MLKKVIPLVVACSYALSTSFITIHASELTQTDVKNASSNWICIGSNTGGGDSFDIY